MIILILSIYCVGGYLFSFLTPVAFLLVPVLIAQIALLCKSANWSQTISIYLCFIVSAGVVSWWTWFYAGFDEPVTRLVFWGYLTRSGRALAVFYEFWFITILHFLICLWCAKFLRSYKDPQTKLNISFKKLLWHSTPVLLLTLAPALYLCTYKTLEQAVKERDFDLIEKRVQFNLLGVGVDNGFLIWGSFGHFSSSCVSYALQQDDAELAAFLIDLRDGESSNDAK